MAEGWTLNLSTSNVLLLLFFQIEYCFWLQKKVRVKDIFLWTKWFLFLLPRLKSSLISTLHLSEVRCLKPVYTMVWWEFSGDKIPPCSFWHSLIMVGIRHNLNFLGNFKWWWLWWQWWSLSWWQWWWSLWWQWWWPTCVGILFIIWAKRGVWRKVWYFADGHLSLPLYLPPTRAYKNICFQMIRQEKLLRKDSVISIVCNKFMSKFTSSSIYMYLIYIYK